MYHSSSVIHQPAPASASVAAPTSSKLDKTVKSDLPKWQSTQYKACAPFFTRIEQVFAIHSVTDDSLRRRYLYHTLSDLPSSDTTYAFDNIINTNLSWTDVKRAFAKRYEQYDHVAKITRDYHTIRYESRDTIQSFSHRFITLCTELDYDTDAKTVRDHFIHSLPPFIHKRLLVQCHARDVSVADFTTLTAIVDELIKLELIHNTSASSVSTSSSSHSDTRRSTSTPSSSSTSTSKHCRFHPHSTTHSTSECRLRAGTAIVGSQYRPSYHPQTSSPAVKSNTASPSSVTCYRCHQQGHYADKCPNTSTSSGSSQPARAASTGKGAPPSSSPSASTSHMQLRTPLERAPSAAHLLPTRKIASVTTVASNASSSPSLSPDRNINIIDRTLPIELFAVNRDNFDVDVFDPVPDHLVDAPHIALRVDGVMYRGLVDTGACTTCVDTFIPIFHRLAVTPAEGSVRMANVNSVTQRLGTCRASVDIIAHGCVIHFTHAFEVLPLYDRHKSYHFIIGRDVLYPLFHDGLSSRFFKPDAHSALPEFADPHFAAIVASLRPTASSDTSADVDVSMLSVDSGCIDISDVHVATITQELKVLEQHVHDTGAGHVAENEQPLRPTLSDSASPSSSPSSTSPTNPFAFLDVPDEYSETRDALISLLLRNETITSFCSLPDSQVTLTLDDSMHHLLYRRQYPIPQQLWSLADQVIRRWFETGKITYAPVGCPFNLPLTIAPKKDDNGHLTGIRVCLDTRVLNSMIKNNDKFQIPNIRETLEMFANCSLFGEFDLSEAYLQFELHPDSRQYTAFTWNHVQYMFVGVPFGINFIPSHFQRCISRLFHDLPFVSSYFDNLPFGSSDWSAHLDQAIIIVSRLNSVNLRIKPSSVKVGRSQMKCLGHIVSSRGIGIDPDKVSVIADYPRPKSGDQMMKFLGVTGYVSSHVRNYAELSAPLQAVKFEKTLEWTDDMIHAFDTLKHAVATAPFLQYPDFTRPFHLATDASNTGIGGVLYQPRHEDEHVTADNIVALHGHVLSSTQRRYPAYKKELCAIISCLRKFHSYIWGRDDLVIVTDHKPLTYIMTSTQLSPALQQWLDVLLDYTFDIRHRDGILHVLPDMLSRLYTDVYDAPTSVWGVESSVNKLSELAGRDPTLVDSSIPTTPSPPRTAPTRDVHIRALTRRQLFWQPVDPATVVRSSSTPPSSTTLSSSPPSSAPSSLQSDTGAELAATPDAPTTLLGEETTSVVSQLSLDTLPSDSTSSSSDEIDLTESDNSVASEDSSSSSSIALSSHHGMNRLNAVDLAIELEKRGKMIPKTLEEQQQLIRDAHLHGHFGISAVFKKIWNKGYWWPKMRADIQDELTNCDACTRFNVTKSGFHPFTPITALGPGDHYQIDLSTHLPPSSDGYNTLFALIDVFTGFVVLRALRGSTAETIAHVLWDIFCLIGWPRILQSDNGPEFVNDIIRALIKLTGIDHRLISPYNPRADGKVERVIGSTMMIIKKLLHGAKHNWSLYVPFAQVTFNDKVSSLTGSSPFALMFGRSLNELRDYTLDAEAPQPITLNDWHTHQEKILSLIIPAISDRTRQSKDKLAVTLAKHRRMLSHKSMPTGATVMIKDQTRANKFEPKYVGPYIIVRRARNGAYVLKDVDGDLLDRHVPADQIKLISKTARAKDAHTYTVNKIIKHRGAPGSYEYFVDWKGFNESYRTWEPEASFNDDRCITDYWHSLNTPRVQ